MSNAPRTESPIVVTVGECRVEITESFGKWLCRATLAGEYHLALADKSYKSAKTAQRAAEKWARETSERLAAEDAMAAKVRPSEGSAAWVDEAFAAWESGDVAQFNVKL